MLVLPHSTSCLRQFDILSTALALKPLWCNMASSKSPIAAQSRQCSDLFDRLSLALGTMDPGNGMSSAACQDEFGRFRIWANNIGALLTLNYRNSLDFRLSRATKVSSRVLEFLGDLEEALNDCKTNIGEDAVQHAYSRT